MKRKTNWGNVFIFGLAFMIICGYALVPWLTVFGLVLIYLLNTTEVKDAPRPKATFTSEEYTSGRTTRDKNGKYIKPEQVIEKKPFQSEAAYRKELRTLEEKRNRIQEDDLCAKRRQERYEWKRRCCGEVIRKPDGTIHHLSTLEYYQTYPIFVKDLYPLTDQQREAYGISREDFQNLKKMREQAIFEETHDKLFSHYDENRKPVYNWHRNHLGEKSYFWELSGEVFDPEN